ncbi:translation initiation factor IF-2-like [Rosa chinensis]|uniref:translation initiation factor IF-2-like n=1 Tax=Rosa chinensis TaxID=74649 RepID=UPI000D09566D|nr:translation initiation factor IF-2-like [Rosa chinensis]
MATPKWACMALLLFLSLGVGSAGRAKVVDKPEKFVLDGHIGLKPGVHMGGIIEGALGHNDKSPQSPPTPPPSPSDTSVAGARGDGYGGGQGSGYGSGQVGGIIGGGGGGGGGGGFGGGGSGGGSFGRGGGGGWSGGGGGGGGREGGDDCGDQSGGDDGDQGGSPSIVVPGFTIPGFDIGGVIGGGISTGSSGLYCTPINCRGNDCKGVHLYFDNSNAPNMAPILAPETLAGSNGQKQNVNHEVEDKHSMDTLASEPSTSLDTKPRSPDPKDDSAAPIYVPVPVPDPNNAPSSRGRPWPPIDPPTPPSNTLGSSNALAPEPSDALELEPSYDSVVPKPSEDLEVELSVVPKPAPGLD